MLAADQVVAASSPRRIPELAALALPHWIPGDHDIASPHEPLAERLVVRLAVGGMPGGHQHRRMRRAPFIGHVHQRRDEDPGQALEDQLLDVVSRHLDAAGDLRVEGRARRGKAAKHPEELCPQFRLQSQQVGLGADAREPGTSSIVLAPCHLGLIREIRRDARAIGRRVEDRKSIRWSSGGCDAERRDRGENQDECWAHHEWSMQQTAASCREYIRFGGVFIRGQR